MKRFPLLAMAVFVVAVLFSPPASALAEPPPPDEMPMLDESPAHVPVAIQAEPMKIAPAPAQVVITKVPAAPADLPPSQNVKNALNWDALAAMGGLAGFLNALLRVLRMTPLEGFLDARGLKWVKPLAAGVIGAILGGWGAWELAAPISMGITGGFMAGLTAVGAHEALNPRKSEPGKNSQDPAEVAPGSV